MPASDKERKEKDPAKKAAVSRRRNRVPISCTICRRRKVKCDKKKPVCTSCQRTGVAHLCHYIEPPWAQPVSNTTVNYSEAPQEEIDALKKRLRELEAQLGKARFQAGTSHSADGLQHISLHEQQDPLMSPRSRGSSFDSNNDTLDLGKKFDMLHIKSTTTVHLGATSWLAIMKGDPYLRVLWAHIFKLRKQVEQIKFQNQATNQNGLQHLQKESHLRAEDPKVKQENSDLSLPKCPVSGKSSSIETCPVNNSDERFNEHLDHHSQYSATPRNSLEEHSLSQRTSSDEDEDSMNDDAHESPRTDTSRLDEKVCPLMIGDSSFVSKISTPDAPLSSERSNDEKFSCPFNTSATSGMPDIKFETAIADGLSGSNPAKKYHNRDNESSKSVSALEFNKNPVGMLEKYLPSKKVLWLLIQRFFDVLYVYMPFVDEETLKEDIGFIFGNPDDENQEIHIKIRSGNDFALAGTVCIILRLSWDSLPKNNSINLLKNNAAFNTNKRFPEDPEIIEILEDPVNEVPLKLVECVKHCFSNLKLMRKSSLKIVQCALYMKLYFKYSPQDGDSPDGGDSQIFLGTMIQMAISIGLYRDPQNFENFSNERQRHLWRKIWFQLISLDTIQSMNLGCPRVLQQHAKFSDTKLPGGDTDEDIYTGEFKDDLRELTIIKNLRTQARVDDLISRTMNILLNVKEPAKKYQVDNLIDELTKCVSGFDESVDKYSLPQLGKILVNRAKQEPLYRSGTRALEFQSHVIINMLIYLLNYILYVHFEPRGAKDPAISTLAQRYAQRALDSALEGYRNCTLFFDCGLDYFGPGADIILSPLLLLVGHRSMQFMVSLILRARCGPVMKPSIDEQFEIVTGENQGDAQPDLEGSNRIDNTNHDLSNVVIKDEEATLTSNYHVDVNSGETLATILLGHMERFHNLADTLGQKYNYSWRMGKAVRFFVTLLKKPRNTVKEMVKSDNVKDAVNNKGYVSDILNSVPLVLSMDEEQVKKCPVYMKSTANETNNNSFVNNSTTERPSNSSRAFFPSAELPTELFEPNEVQGIQQSNPVFNNMPLPQDMFTPGSFPQPSNDKYNNSSEVPAGNGFPDMNNVLNPFIQAVEMNLNTYSQAGDVEMTDSLDGPNMKSLDVDNLMNLSDADKNFDVLFGLGKGFNGLDMDGSSNGFTGMNKPSQSGDMNMDFNAMMSGSWFN